MSTAFNKLNLARVAFDNGQLDRADRLLDDTKLRQCAQGKTLSKNLANQLVHRAKQRAALGDTSAGWRDLNRAKAFGADLSSVAEIRTRMIHDALSEAERLLAADDTDAALAKLDRLHRRNVSGGKVGEMRKIVLKTRRAGRLARVGRFEEAASELAAAGKLRKDLTVLNKHHQQCRRWARAGKKLAKSLSLAVGREDWQRAMNVADELLAIAPENAAARQIRRQVGTHLSEQFNDSDRRRRTATWKGQRAAVARHHNTPRTVWSEAPALAENSKCPNQRLLLWVDAVGGFLVCLSDDLLIGQAVPGSKADIAVFADLSRQHVRLRREDGSYILQPIASVCVNEATISGPTLLHDGDEIQLGEAVRYRFRQPHPLSSTARLEPLSGHRTQPAADAILLMAESCVLGPKLANHVVAADWEEDVILFRQEGQLHVRTTDILEINGTPQDGRGRVTHGSQVCGEDFSFTVEELG